MSTKPETPAAKAAALLDRLRALAQEATPGRWDAGAWTVGGSGFTHGAWEWISNDGRPNPGDATFIAAARNAMLALVEALDVVRGADDAAVDGAHGLALDHADEILARAFDALEPEVGA